jgi:hypothetical protein
MSSRTYHQRLRLDEGARDSAVVEENPWLDDKTTTLYRPQQLRQRTKPSKPVLDSAPSQHSQSPTAAGPETAARTTTRRLRRVTPASNQRAHASAQQARIPALREAEDETTQLRASSIPPLPPLPAAASAQTEDSSREVAIRMQPPTAAPEQPDGSSGAQDRPSAVQLRTLTEGPQVAEVKIAQEPQVASAGRIRRSGLATSRQQPATLRLLKGGTPATPAQLSEAALEAFWREQDDAKVVGRTRSGTWLRVLVALVAVSGGVVLGREQLSSGAWHIASRQTPKLQTAPVSPAPSPKLDTTIRASDTAGATTASTPESIPAPAAPSSEEQPRARPAQPRSKRQKRAPVAASAAREAATRAEQAENNAKTDPSGSTAVAAEQPAAAAADYASSGFLRIDSRPWSQVSIDDVRIGNTPQLQIRLAPGIHSVRLYNPELSLVKIITLDVRPGERIDRSEVLQP